MRDVGIRLYTANQLDNDLFDLILVGKSVVNVYMSKECFACDTNMIFKVDSDGLRVAVVH